MVPRAPPDRASNIFLGVMRLSLSNRLTTMATSMEMDAENWTLLMLVLTMTTSTTIGASR